MPLDYQKLSQVTDDLKFGRKARATAEGLKVVDSVESPLNALSPKTDDSAVILGDAEIRRIVDSDFKDTNFSEDFRKKIQDAYKSLKPQVVILDAAQVKKIMTAPASEQRQFMSRLSDSERRRVLAMWKKIKDEENTPEPPAAEPPADPATQVDPEPAQEPVQEDLLQEDARTEQPDTPVLLMMFDAAISNTYVEPSYKEFLAKLNEQYSEVPEAVPEPVRVIMNHILNDESISREEVDAYKQLFTDNSITSAFVDYYDIIESKDVDLDVDAEIQTAAEDDAEIATDRSLATLADASIKRFVAKGYDYYKVRDAYFAHFTMAYRSRIADSTTASVLSKVSDVSIQKAFDQLEPEEDVKPTVIELVESALQAYVNGSPEELEHLSKVTPEELAAEIQNPNQEATQEDNPEEPAEPQEPVKEPENPEEPAEGAQEPEEPVDNTVNELQDIISLAQSILERHTNGALVDSLIAKGHTYLNKYAVRISDACPCCVEHSEGAPIDPPMTVEDYYGIAPVVPCAFGPVAHAMYGKQCLPVDSWKQDGDYLEINGCQKMFPCYPIEEIVAQLNTEGADIQKVIGSTCITMDDALRAAAAMDALSFIDNRFYHKTHSDPAWYFDECPTCLEGVAADKHSVLFKNTMADCEDTVDIYGTQYTLR